MHLTCHKFLKFLTFQNFFDFGLFAPLPLFFRVSRKSSKLCRRTKVIIYSRCDSMNLFSYLEKLPTNELLELYSDSSTCQVVFRNLPTLAQNFVMKMIYLPRPFRLDAITSWTLEDKVSKQKHEAALQKLLELKICTKTEKQTKFSTISEYQNDKKKGFEFNTIHCFIFVSFSRFEVEMNSTFRESFLSGLTQM